MRLIGNIASAEAFLSVWRDDGPTVLAHTSGSTGAPKRIELLKVDMRESAKATCCCFGITSESKLLLPLSADYIAGKMMIVRAEIADAELIVETPSNNPLVDDYGMIDLMAVVPSQLDALFTNPRLNIVRNIIVGGAPLSPQQESRCRALATHVYATYGMTETCSHVALRDVSSGDLLYRALPGISFSADMRGCLVIEAPLFSFKRLATNDIVRLDGPYAFQWLGRIDNVVNSGGVKLHPEIIEQNIAVAVNAPFYVIGRPSQQWGEELVMYVEGANVDVKAIRNAIQSLLSKYEMPKEIIVVLKFERTSSGKIVRKIYN
jgi:O-succinylbenzoic acid--CoA ligase